MSERCLVHGAELHYDMRSGFDICYECERDKPAPSAAPAGEPRDHNWVRARCEKCRKEWRYDRRERLGIDRPLCTDCESLAGDAVPRTPEPDLNDIVANLRDHYNTDWDTTIPGKEFDAEIKRIVAAYVSSVTANKEAEIVQLQNFNDNQRETITDAFRKLDELRAEVERLRKEIVDWKNTLDMYQQAWMREIGGFIIRKSHQIDGYVLRTREVYTAARNWWAYQNGLKGKDPFWNVPEPPELGERKL